ncbi:hypothetical protein GR11A_00139 [Vibrio phage vB_VcorM_GR11A]|nr:hypothetical protein GR11A_00139 [Vibrio phage vB_VcorM_GR11A]
MQKEGTLQAGGLGRRILTSFMTLGLFSPLFEDARYRELSGGAWEQWHVQDMFGDKHEKWFYISDFDRSECSYYTLKGKPHFRCVGIILSREDYR